MVWKEGGEVSLAHHNIFLTCGLAQTNNLTTSAAGQEYRLIRCADAQPGRRNIRLLKDVGRVVLRPGEPTNLVPEVHGCAAIS